MPYRSQASWLLEGDLHVSSNKSRFPWYPRLWGYSREQKHHHQNHYWPPDTSVPGISEALLAVELFLGPLLRSSQGKNQEHICCSLLCCGGDHRGQGFLQIYLSTCLYQAAPHTSTTHLVLGSSSPAHLYADSTLSLVTSWRVNIKKKRQSTFQLKSPRKLMWLLNRNGSNKGREEYCFYSFWDIKHLENVIDWQGLIYHLSHSSCLCTVLLPTTHRQTHANFSPICFLPLSQRLGFIIILLNRRAPVAIYN